MSQSLQLPRVVVGGVSSGVGKTTFAIGLIAALRRRGLSVAPFKAGPDYLDPGYHRIAAGRNSINIDGWMMGKEAVLRTMARGAEGADIAVVEGVMGLFDGASPLALVGSTAELAGWTNSPVVLVADGGGMAGSFAALCQGYANFSSDVSVRAAIANRLGSQGHLDLLRRACEFHADCPPLLGGLPKQLGIQLPERHLGLVSADSTLLSDDRLEALANLIEEWVDLESLIQLARSAPDLQLEDPGRSPSPVTPCRIAIARDSAFHFYYEDNLRLLEAAGAVLVPFSPISDECLPAADALYIGGGYPELFAGDLAENKTMRQDILEFSRSGRPVYAECGGLMYLQESIRTLDGQLHKMTGVFDGVATMRPRRVALGYVEVEITLDCILGSPGWRFRGHQFRYSDIEGCTATNMYRIRGRRARQAEPAGFAIQRTVGSYVHGHWASHPQVAQSLVASACAARSDR